MAEAGGHPTEHGGGLPGHHEPHEQGVLDEHHRRDQGVEQRTLNRQESVDQPAHGELPVPAHSGGAAVSSGRSRLPLSTRAATAMAIIRWAAR